MYVMIVQWIQEIRVLIGLDDWEEMELDGIVKIIAMHTIE